MARLQCHPREVGHVPGADDDAARVGLLPQQPHDLGDLIDVSAVRRRPAAPLHAVDGAEIAVLVGPLVPDRDAVLLQPADVSLAAKKPQQLVGDRREMHLLGRHEREALGEIEAHLVAEDADRSRSGAVLLGRPAVENVAGEVLVLGADDSAGTGHGHDADDSARPGGACVSPLCGGEQRHASCPS